MRELFFESDVPLLVHFRGVSVESDDDILDFIVESSVVVLIRSLAGPVDADRSKLKSYLRHSGIGAGLLVNFNTRDLRTGIWRVVNNGRCADDISDVVLPA